MRDRWNRYRLFPAHQPGLGREARWRRFRRRAQLVFRGTHMRDRAPMQKSKDWKGGEREGAERAIGGEEAETGRRR